MNEAGAWIDAPPLPNAYAVNIGDMLELWTNGEFVATSHRVRKVREERYSFPLFFAVDYNTRIAPMPRCSAPEVRSGRHSLPVSICSRRRRKPSRICASAWRPASWSYRSRRSHCRLSASRRNSARSGDVIPRSALSERPMPKWRSAMRQRISNIRVAPTRAVLPVCHKAAPTSTTSPPMRFNPRNPRRSRCPSNVVMPPISGRPRAGRIDGIEPVHIEQDVCRPIADDLTSLLDDTLDTERSKLLDEHHSHTHRAGELDSLHEVSGRHGSDLDGPPRIEQPRLDSEPKRCSMMEFGSRKLSPRIGMRVDMHHFR